MAKSEFNEEIDRGSSPSAVTPKRSPQPDQRLEGVELERQVQQAISELDEDHRILIVLRDIEELSYEEICEIMDLAEGTVKSRLHRARMALRKKMMKRM
jgi:RNA polymerase sigma-70 factor (ECF subfamily)